MPTGWRRGWSCSGWRGTRESGRSHITALPPTTADGLRNRSGPFPPPASRPWSRSHRSRCPFWWWGTGIPLCFPGRFCHMGERRDLNGGGLRVNFLVNYGWEWDLAGLRVPGGSRRKICGQLRSRDVSRVDMVIRWGGMRRLSGFLPVQSVYADFSWWTASGPTFSRRTLNRPSGGIRGQDVTRGG